MKRPRKAKNQQGAGGRGKEGREAGKRRRRGQIKGRAKAGAGSRTKGLKKEKIVMGCSSEMEGF